MPDDYTLVVANVPTEHKKIFVKTARNKANKTNTKLEQYNTTFYPYSRPLAYSSFLPSRDFNTFIFRSTFSRPITLTPILILSFYLFLTCFSPINFNNILQYGTHFFTVRETELQDGPRISSPPSLLHVSLWYSPWRWYVYCVECLNASNKSNPSSVLRCIVDSYSTPPWVTWEAVTVVEGIPWWGCYDTGWLCSTQAKVEGIMLKAAWHWGRDCRVLNDPLGEPGRTTLYVGLPSTWGSADGD